MSLTSSPRVLLLGLSGTLPLVLACTERTQPSRPAAAVTPPPAAASSGWFRAALIVGEPGDEIEVPFFLRLPRQGRGELLNDERSIAVDHRWDGSKVEVRMRDLDVRIEARVDEAGELAGQFIATHPRYAEMKKPGEEGATFPFRARPVTSPDPATRFSWPDGPSDAAPGAFAGTWRVTPAHPFSAWRGAATEYKAVFRQTANVIRGDVIMNAGDTPPLVGNVRGKEIALSGFDGPHFVLVRATLEDPNRLRGEMFLLRYRTSFTAERVDKLSLFDVQRPSPTLPVSKWQIPALTRKPYQGHPVILEILGSWCGTCREAEPVLRDLYGRHHGAGLEVLGLSLEFTDDREEARRLIERHVRAFGVDWEIIPVFSEEVDTMLAAFPEVSALPITVFINRDGTVEWSHVGFVGPSSPEDHKALVASFEAHTQAILASPARK